ncbi:MAG TPA: exosortase/archaeosortase family protein [Caldilineae bacterium]|nr:exosortase/archaeosortase family protein [Caldilineae bacterium]
MRVTVGRAGWWQAAVMGALFLIIASPTLRWLVNEWWTNDYYSHGLLVPPIAAFFAWRLWPGVHRRPSNAGIIALGAGLALYLGALVDRAYFIASFALIILLAGLVWFLLGTQALRRLAFPLGFLVFMVPLPFIEEVTLPLAQFTGVSSSYLIRLFGVKASVSGLQVSLPNTDLVVGAQCSGVRSIIALFTLTAIAIYMLRGPLWAKLILALATIPIAVLGNVFRVASLLLVANVWGADAGFTFYHDYSGIVFFLTAFGALLFVSQVVGCREIRDDIW